MATVQVQTHQKFAGLDGLRGVAVLAVVLFHAKAPWIKGGYLGVDLFFPLSGFLITWSLLARRQRLPRLGALLKDFYKRRFLRLFPALAILIILVVIYSFTIAPAWIREQSVPSIPYVLASIGNIASVNKWWPGSLGILGHTWSLAVEEQFYLVWPITLWLLLGLKGKLWRWGILLVALGLASAIWRVACLQTEICYADSLYFRTDTHADGLLFGSALALFLFGRKAADLKSGMASKNLLFIAAVTILLLEFLFSDGLMWRPLPPLWVCLAATILIYVFVTSPTQAWFSKLVGVAPLRYFGRISYGLYLYHFAFFIALEQVPEIVANPVLHWVLMLTVPLALAILSFEFVEKRFLKISKHSDKQNPRNDTEFHGVSPVGFG